MHHKLEAGKGAPLRFIRGGSRNCDPGICVRGSPLVSRFLSFPTLPSLSSHSLPSPLLPLRSRVLLNQIGVGGALQAENEFGTVYRSVRKPLAAIILNILKCMIYSRSVKI